MSGYFFTCQSRGSVFFFFFNDTATTEIYTLSLHDALPIFARAEVARREARGRRAQPLDAPRERRSEEHTSELQSRVDLVCRLLLEKKKKINISTRTLQYSNKQNSTIPSSHKR